jgi:biopolymer transport protein ExbB
MNLTEQFLNFTLLGAEWVLWLLVVLSVFSVAIMVERGLFFYRRVIDAEVLARDARAALRGGTIDEFIESYRSRDSMAVQVAIAGLSEIGGGLDAASEAMNSEKSRQRHIHEQNLVVLGTLGNNAPFIGLFGTVLGIIKAFQDLEENPQGGIEVVMSSLSEALVATAVGLLVAIPAVVAFNAFSRRVRAALSTTDSVAHVILGELHARDNGVEKR